jgi:hypothetical protein
MSSKSVKQAMAILAACHGALLGIKDDCSLGAQEVVKALDSALAAADCAMRLYPGAVVKDERADGKWIIERMLRWKKSIESVPREFEYFVLVSIAHQCVVDLLGKVRDKKKIFLLEPLLQALQHMSDFSDPLGRNIAAFECAESALRELYTQVDFQP